MRFQRLVLALAVAGVLAAGAAAHSSRPRTLPTTTPVTGLATNGSTVAVATAWSAGHCERMLAWNPVRAYAARARGRAGAATRRARAAGSSARRSRAPASPGSPTAAATRTTPSSTPHPSRSRPSRTGSSSPVGTSIRARATGSARCRAPARCSSTPPGRSATPGSRPSRHAPRASPRGRSTTRSSGGSTASRAESSSPRRPTGSSPVGVAAGRILVARAGGTAFELRGADGHVIQTYQPDAEALQATLGPQELVLAVRTPLVPPLSKGRVQFIVYNLATGAVERTLPVPATAALTVTSGSCNYPVGGPAVACVSPVARLRFANADATRFVYVLDTAVHVAGWTARRTRHSRPPARLRSSPRSTAPASPTRTGRVAASRAACSTCPRPSTTPQASTNAATATAAAMAGAGEVGGKHDRQRAASRGRRSTLATGAPRHSAGQRTDDELVEAHALLVGGTRQLGMQRPRHADKQFAAGERLGVSSTLFHHLYHDGRVIVRAASQSSQSRLQSRPHGLQRSAQQPGNLDLRQAELARHLRLAAIGRK